MSEEPRRSVRSTKGYHSHKEQEIEGNMEQPKKKSTKKGGNKKAAASRDPTPVAEANEEGDIIRCICGATTQDNDEEGEGWVACELCSTWQHNICMGIPTENAEELPDYFCERCRPAQHLELLEAVKRGEQIWITRRQKHDAEKKARKNRKGKGGGTKKRKSEPKATAQRANGQTKESPAASVREDSASAKKDTATKAGAAKRKTREESQDQDSVKVKQRKVSDVSAVPATPASSGKQPASATPAPPPATPILDHVMSDAPPADVPAAIGDLKDKAREDLAKLLRKNIETALKTASDNGNFKASADNSIPQTATRLALEVERAIHDSQNSREAYVAQCKLVAINLKRNAELFGNLLSGELSANQVAVMSEDDMKTSEQRQKDEEELARAERQSIMLKEDGPRVRRTHKGEELVEDNYAASSEIPSREQRDPNANMAVRSRENSQDQLIEVPSDIDSGTHTRPPLNVNTQASSHERKPSVQASEFDYSKVVSQLPTPTNQQASRRISGPAPVPRETLVDPEVDALLAAADADTGSPPYSPKESFDPSVVWFGRIEMSAIGAFDAIAKHMGGADLDGQHRTTYDELLGKKPMVTGRIEPEKADEYLCSLRYSQGSDIIVVGVTPRGQASTEEFNKIFDYFVAKQRYGVIGSRMGPIQVRDIYLIPIEVGEDKQIPEFMANLEVNKIPQYREERMMLVAIVYREEQSQVDGQHSPGLVTHPQRQMSALSAPTMSPLTQHDSFKSPMNHAQQERAEAQMRGEALARQILGEDLFAAATLAFILPNAHMMVAKEWEVIKGLLVAEPKARDDLQYLGQLLADRANQDQQNKMQQQNNDAGMPTPQVRT